MIEDVEMLNYIHQNAEMGRDNIMHMIKMTDDTRFRHSLQTQLEEFEIIYNDSDGMLKEIGNEPEKVSPVAKLMSYTGSTIKSLSDHSPSHLAELMIEGSTMGITTLTKQLNNYNGKDKKILHLAEKELKTEQNNIEEMKKFLS